MAKTKKNRSKSSSAWMKEHFDDPYVKKAQQMGYRSRAAFKLQELQDKDKLVKSGSTVVDLGAAPGGWSQLAAKWVGDRGIVVASDILAMDSIAGVQFVQGDFTEQQAYDEILNIIGNKGADLVISDMAPNMSGMSVTDQSRAMYLAELALDLARQILATNGSYAIKLFQGEGFDDYLGLLRKDFNKVLIRKPSASRPRSREVYAVAKGFKGVSNR